VNKEIVVNVCLGTGGIAAGGIEVMDAFREQFDAAGIEAKVEKRCTVNKVGCSGFCARDVLVDVIIDGQCTTYQYVKPDMVKKIIDDHLVANKPLIKALVGDDYHDFHKYQEKVLLADCGSIDPESVEAYLAIDGYKAAEKALQDMDPAEVVSEVKDSGLRGRGGAGFPTGDKWQICADTEADQRYVICNADEGDPGSFMDRTLVEGNPHAVIEGMMISAFAVGATKGYVFIRAEYQLAVARLEKALQQAREKGFLGTGLCSSSFDFDIEINLGPGAFVCGEETAIIASIEGRRGMPMPKPPYPAQSGLWGKPTLINNVETLAALPHIIRKGAAWYSAIGFEKSKGTKLITLAGHVKNAGLIEVPLGMSIKDIVFKIGGGLDSDKLFKAVYSGGPTGGFIPIEHLDLRLDYESLSSIGSMLGSGILNVLDESDCVVDLCRSFLEFTQAESCGKCVPCRVGSKRMLEILTKITEGEGKVKDLKLLEELAQYVYESSLCGLGRYAPSPVFSALKFFRHEFETHIRLKKCPAKSCKSLLTYFIRKEFCVGCGMCKKVCPVGAITGEKKGPHQIDPSICIKCGSCYDKCKFGAAVKE
jgi:NADH:ubiquinone oxidoreductase subunit F (NADH-binding)/(2Fe-2S) ferredoxin/Pyruvate/2-oxoacid:ferredoxin oxidoreductase delta subunit